MREQREEKKGKLEEHKIYANEAGTPKWISVRKLIRKKNEIIIRRNQFQKHLLYLEEASPSHLQQPYAKN